MDLVLPYLYYNRIGVINMFFYQLTGIQKIDGNATAYNYSPVLIDDILPGTAVYDVTGDKVVFSTTLEQTISGNLTSLTEQVYQDTIKTFNAQKPVVTPIVPVEEQLAAMKTLNAQMLTALVNAGLI
jgi:hypothetical protein